MVDPFPQAMVLTAIVITFGVTAFLLAMAYRSCAGGDEVPDDVEDRRICTERRRRDEEPDATPLEEVNTGTEDDA